MIDEITEHPYTNIIHLSKNDTPSTITLINENDYNDVIVVSISMTTLRKAYANHVRAMVSLSSNGINARYKSLYAAIGKCVVTDATRDSVIEVVRVIILDRVPAIAIRVSAIVDNIYHTYSCQIHFED